MAFERLLDWAFEEAPASSKMDKLSANDDYLYDAWLGVPKWCASVTIPSDHMLADGTAISKTTYPLLWNVLHTTKGTFTITLASPGVVTLNSHGMITGDRVYLTTTGALPTGLAINTNYWVVYINANTFSLASSQANALAGTSINTSVSQSGTHTLTYAPWGISGSTNYLLPDLQGRLLVGASGSTGKALIGTTGLDDGRTLAQRNISHRHTFTIGTQGGSVTTSGYMTNDTSATTTGDTDNTNYPAFAVGRWILLTV